MSGDDPWQHACSTQAADPTSPSSVARLVNAAQEAASAADWQAVKEAARKGLTHLTHPIVANPEAAVKLLLLQGTAAHHMQQHADALKALDLALQLKPTCQEGLMLRAAVHAAAGHHTASFMDLRTLSQQQPDYPGVAEAMQQAAQAVAQQQAACTHAKPPPPKTYIRTTRRAAPQADLTPSHAQHLSAYAVLGLHPGCQRSDVRKAYKQLASQLHPDKWVLEAASGRQASAEERFKQVSAAYQEIMATLKEGPAATG